MSRPPDPALNGARPVVLGVLRGEHAGAATMWPQADDWMHTCLTTAGMSPRRAWATWKVLKSVMRTMAAAGAELETIERALRPLFKRQTARLYRPGAERRAANSYARLAPHLVGEALLDLGAGNGLIGEVVGERTGMRVALADVVDYLLTELPLHLYPQGGAVPLPDKSVDTTLLYLVLHHADEPDALLAEAVRLTRRRIVVMEGHVEDEDTRLCNAFFDWFLNRVVQSAAINLPLNYRTVAGWHATFADLGLRVVHTEAVGVDEPLAPEAHVLYVVDVPAEG